MRRAARRALAAQARSGTHERDMEMNYITAQFCYYVGLFLIFAPCFLVGLFRPHEINQRGKRFSIAFQLLNILAILAGLSIIMLLIPSTGQAAILPESEILYGRLVETALLGIIAGAILKFNVGLFIKGKEVDDAGQ